MQHDVKPEKVVLAVAKAIEAKFTRGDWLALAYETGCADRVREHPRLLRSLDWNDEDYSGHVLDMVEEIIRPSGRTVGDGPYRIATRAIDAANFAVAERMLGLPEWLAQYEPVLFSDIYGSQVADVGVDELQAAAKELGLADVDEHAARIRRGIRDDPAQAIGSAKELVETVLKAVLGLHGNGPETKKEIPYLLKEANIALGLDPAGAKGSEPGAVQRRKALGALTNLVNSIAELRNAGFGTGHGLSQRPTLDVATARLAVSAAVTAATFYIEAHAAEQA
ncbi:MULTISPECIES: abortive infection family protein [Streptomyces]|uniref:abortive infection family protein n=1 Tax=Streptomyces TaxID=1883 RepID=UPI0029A4D628|nr:abortive infection family protein [Streptomyces stelliscabiei]MDX2514604.1 abortive infection family protein [Streptomyces stelliscabiei]MDX2661167.1 abortive infection family protein [Streptomyces stelliscabiei]MDX2790144.1 abortive infection family protein [Streptomyces stelliscabiei]